MNDNKIMEKELKIVAPDGYEIDRENSTLERIVFKKKPIALPKSWEEFCSRHPKQIGESFITNDSSIGRNISSSTRFPSTDRNVLPDSDAARQHLALMQLHQLRDYYRQGWVPDWSTATHKWGVLLMNGNIVVKSSMSTSVFLSFDKEDTAKEFAINFPDLIKQAGDLI